VANQNDGENGAVGDSVNNKDVASPHTAQIQNANPFGPEAISPQEYQKYLKAQQSQGLPSLDEPTGGSSERRTQPGKTDGIITSKPEQQSAPRVEQPAPVKGTDGSVTITPPGVKGVETTTETTALAGIAPGKDVAKPVVPGQTDSQAPVTRGGPQGADVVPAGTVKATDTRAVPSEVKSNPSEVRSTPTEVRPNTTEVKSSPVESRVNPAITDGGSVSRPVNAQAIETPQQSKAAGTTQGERVATSDNAGGHKVEPSTAAVGAAYMPPGRKDEVVPSTTTNRPAVAESATANVATNTVRAELKPDSKSTAEGSTTTAGSQFRAESKVEPTSVLPTSAQQKFDTQKAEPLATGQGKFEPVKGSDVISTQGSTDPTAKVDGSRLAEPRLDTGKPVDQPGAKDSTTFRDPKTASVANEVLGQKTDAAPRSDTSTSAGIKSDASGQKADQVVRGIESRINEGPKQPSAGDARVPGSTETSTAGRQPGTTDGASSGSRQPSAETGSKSHGIVDGDKGTSGGGGSITAESTRKIDVGMPQGGKAEGQSGSSGMGGGSSAPIDRTPHAPFKIEEAQPSGSKSDAGLKGDIGGKGEAAGVGKSPAAADGTRFDSGEVRGNQPGARFDTGETRGNQPGTRFDTGEIKDGRSGITTGGKSGDVGGVIGAEAGTIKGTDVSGVKASTGGGQGIGGSSGSGSADAGILGEKRQPSMFPDSPAGPGGKPVKPGDGIASGQVSGDDSVPFVLPGGFGGKDGGRRQSDQMFGDKTKGGEASGNKPEPGAAAGKAESGSMIAKFDGMVSGKAESNVSGNRNDAAGIKADMVQKPETGRRAETGQRSESGQKADAVISAAMAGQVGAGASEVGNVLKNFAQTVLSDGKSGVTNDGPGQKTRVLDSTLANSDTKPVSGGGPTEKKSVPMSGSTPPGDKVSDVAGARVVGSGAAPPDASKKTELVTSGHGSADILGGTGGDDEGVTAIDEFNLPEVDLLGEVDEEEKVEELVEVDESEEAKLEHEMHYELALGLQLYTSISEAPYGAYHYLTREGDTVEGVAREIVGDDRTAPLVFSLNKEHILASTEYGVHPFKVGVMVQLPTPRDLKNFFGGQK